MSSAGRTQDLAPPGGYAKFNFKRVPLKPILSGKQLFAGYFFISAGATYVYYLTDREIKREQIEMRSSRNVMFPILIAERDREYLKQLRRNRDEEDRIMKNVPGWKTGTWFGEPVFKTAKPDDWQNPIMQEFYAHTADKYFFSRAYMKHWH